MGFPTRIDAYEQLIENAMQVYEIHVTADGKEIGLSNDMLFDTIDGSRLDVNRHALTQEGADTIRAMIESIEHVEWHDEMIMGIIIEELQPFLAGSRSVEDTARVMQSRVQLYLHEIS